jgi:hypothetical protein
MASNLNSKPSIVGKMSFGKALELENEPKFASNNNYQIPHTATAQEYYPKMITGEY